jgi:hypothetical protein
VPVDECKAWADEIKERMLRLGQVTADDLEGDKPDWSQDFWEWESKWRKQKLNNEEKGEYER